MFDPYDQDDRLGGLFSLMIGIAFIMFVALYCFAPRKDELTPVELTPVDELQWSDDVPLVSAPPAGATVQAVVNGEMTIFSLPTGGRARARGNYSPIGRVIQGER